MPILPIKLRPTVNAEYTYALNEAGISACNLIRFKAGLPQKLGGWSRFYPNSVGGVPKALLPWQDLNANKLLAVGTTTTLSVIEDGTLLTITPQQLISDFSPDFSTTSGDSLVDIVDTNIENVTTLDSVFFNTPVSVGGVILQGLYAIDVVTGANSYSVDARTLATATVSNGGDLPEFDVTSGSNNVTVTFPNHGLSIGNTFTFPIPTVVGGITIVGTYKVTGIGSADVFSIFANALATSTDTQTMNGGDAQIVYYLWLGPQASGVGYGVGGYGVGGYGQGIVPDNQTGTAITAEDWTLTNWGEILMACPKNGGIYQWQPSSGFVNAGIIPDAPAYNTGIFMAMPAQILVAYGSTAGIQGLVVPGAGALPQQQDPLTVRWCDQENYLDWVPSATNQAGSYRLSSGSRIVGAIQAPQQAIILTDIEAWAMSYVGPPLVFGFNKIGSGCGLIAQHAIGILRGVVFWMGLDNFFSYSSSGITIVPCSVWDIVFQDLDMSNQHKICCAPNSSFSEISWYYPSISGGTGEPDKYVKLNMEEQSWDYGVVQRSAWVDQSVLGQPLGASPTGIIFQHETSNDADGAPMTPYLTTGWFTIQEGQELSFIDWIFPDMKWKQEDETVSAQILLTIEVAAYPNSAPEVYGPFVMNEAVNYITCRLLGRLIRVTIASQDLGTWWRMGNPRFRAAVAGRR